MLIDPTYHCFVNPLFNRRVHPSLFLSPFNPYLLFLPLQPLNPLLRTLNEPVLPLFNQKLANGQPKHQRACNKQRRHQMPSSLRRSTSTSQGIEDMLKSGVVHSEVKRDIASRLLTCALKNVAGVVAVLPVALPSVMGVIDDLCEHECNE